MLNKNYGIGAAARDYVYDWIGELCGEDFFDIVRKTV